jgi:hypothetical protein
MAMSTGAPATQYVDARELRRCVGDQQLDETSGDSETQQSANDAEQPAFDHELSHDVAIRGAECTTDRQLSRAAGCAEEQEVTHVDARNEQQKANRCDEHNEYRPYIAHHRVRERLDVRAVVGSGLLVGGEGLHEMQKLALGHARRRVRREGARR